MIVDNAMIIADSSEHNGFIVELCIKAYSVHLRTDWIKLIHLQCKPWPNKNMLFDWLNIINV